ncbi:MAG: ATP-binding protein [Bacteroidota bacterium]
MSWSSGKDAALALHYLQQDPGYQVDLLLTTVNSHHDRVSMHGLRRSLLQRQIEAIGLPHESLDLPEQPNMEEYDQLMDTRMQHLVDQGYQCGGYGDIFLEDLKSYRDKQLAKNNLKGVYPLWKRNSKELIREFIDLGLKSVVICANIGLLDESFVGRDINTNFLEDLHEGVDPCGENGEFHTFCYDGPIFRHSVKFEKADKVVREYPNPSSSTLDDDKVKFQFVDLY